MLTSIYGTWRIVTKITLMLLCVEVAAVIIHPAIAYSTYLQAKGATASAIAEFTERNEVHLEFVSGIPIISAVVNGHKARLIVDTGASPSTFAPKVIGDTHSTKFIRTITANGDKLTRTGNAAIVVGDFSANLSNILIDGKLRLPGSADGLLGNDFWAATGGVCLDYRRQRLTIRADADH
jgi:predicted aspartyl protease